MRRYVKRFRVLRDNDILFFLFIILFSTRVQNQLDFNMHTKGF